MEAAGMLPLITEMEEEEDEEEDQDKIGRRINLSWTTRRPAASAMALPSSLRTPSCSQSTFAPDKAVQCQEWREAACRGPHGGQCGAPTGLCARAS